jgi:hypothetical protein
VLVKRAGNILYLKFRQLTRQPLLGQSLEPNIPSETPVPQCVSVTAHPHLLLVGKRHRLYLVAVAVSASSHCHEP